jgi:Cu-Zn family superoxide dismutase
MRKLTRWLALSAVALSACNRPDPAPVPAERPADPAAAPAPRTEETTGRAQVLREDPGAADGRQVSRAVAVMVAVGGAKAHGPLFFDVGDDGAMKVKGELTGLPPGKHAYHVHQFGDCSSADGESAGTHFHFGGSSENPGEGIAHITGDLGDLDVPADGKVSVDSRVDKAALQGGFSIIGRSVIIHERGNDPSKPPMGDAGGRIACGVIGIAKSTPARETAAAAPKHTGQH